MLAALFAAALLATTALGLALVGMVLVVAGGSSGDLGTIQPAGVLLGLAAAACQVLFVTLTRGRYRSVPAEQVQAWQLVVVAAFCALASIAVGADVGVPLANGRALGLVLLTGIVAAGIPSILFLVGLRAIGGTRAGVLMLIEPLVGVTLAALVLGEALRPVQVAGGAAILAGALLLQRSRPGVPSGELPLETLEPAGIPVRDAG